MLNSIHIIASINIFMYVDIIRYRCNIGNNTYICICIDRYTPSNIYNYSIFEFLYTTYCTHMYAYGFNSHAHTFCIPKIHF